MASRGRKRQPTRGARGRGSQGRVPGGGAGLQREFRGTRSPVPGGVLLDGPDAPCRLSGRAGPAPVAARWPLQTWARAGAHALSVVRPAPVQPPGQPH